MQQLLFDTNYMEQAAREALIKKFKENGNPTLLRYYYRIVKGWEGRNKKAYRQDLPTLRILMNEGLVRLTKLDRSARTYEYSQDGFNK